MKLRVSYAKRRYKDKVYTTPLLVTSYRDENGVPRHRTVLNLSDLPAHAIAALEEALRTGETPTSSTGTVAYQSSVGFGDVLALSHLVRELGIKDALAGLSPAQQTIILAMLWNRCCRPQPWSLRALAANWSSTAWPLLTQRTTTPKLDTWYNTLAQLYERQETMEQQLAARRLGSTTTQRVFLYDITSSYFEGTKCPLAAFGYNRDGKKGKKQIVIGLLTDEHGYPLSIEVFTGNTSDQTTVARQLTKLRQRFGAEQLIFIGDRGMITSRRMEDVELGCFGQCIDFITALRRSDMMRLVEADSHPIQLGLFDERELAEVTHGDRRYVLCFNPLRKDEDAATRRRLLELTEAKLQSIANNVDAKRLKKKEKIQGRAFRWLNRWHMGRFFRLTIEEGCFSFERNEDEIERYSRLDGCYVLVTSLPPESMSKEEVQRRYKSLASVEQDFRSLKSFDLDVRPIRVWTEEHVRGHVFLCSLALRINWEARQRWQPLLERNPVNHSCPGGSLSELWETLSNFTIGWLRFGGELRHQLGDCNEHQRKALNLLGITDSLPELDQQWRHVASK